MTASVVRDDLAALREKYRRILALRTSPLPAKAPREELVPLAERFPGALRELDQMPLPSVEKRIAELESAEDDASRVEPWMIAQVKFHRLARGALVAKRWLAGRRDVDDALVAAFEREIALVPYGSDALAWAGELANVARPPGGRLLVLVVHRVANVLEIDAEIARALVFS